MVFVTLVSELLRLQEIVLVSLLQQMMLKELTLLPVPLVSTMMTLIAELLLLLAVVLVVSLSQHLLLPHLTQKSMMSVLVGLIVLLSGSLN